MRTSLKRVMSSVVISVMILTTVLPGTSFAAANDVSGHWAESVITEWQNKGLISGYPDGSFKPDQPVARAEFIKIMNGALEMKAKATVSFTDVKSSDWFYEDVSIAMGEKYCSGFPDNTFRPQAQVTRGEAAVFIANAKKLEKNESEAKVAKDFASFPSWAAPAIGSILKSGYMNGYPDGSFNADGILTRAEAVVTLDRAMAGTEDVVINQAGAKLENQNINGNLITDKAVADGDVHLKNVSVAGDLIIQGGGAKSVHATDVVVTGSVSMDKSGVGLVVDGTTNLPKINILQLCNIKSEASFKGEIGTVSISKDLGTSTAVTIGVRAKSLEISGKSSVNVEQNISQIKIGKNAEGAKLKVGANAKIDTVTADSKIAISGSGKIGTLYANVKGISVSGVKVEKTEGTVPTPPSSGGSGGSSGTDEPSGPSDLNATADVNGGTYRNITIPSSVGDGNITLNGVTIEGTLTVQGGGSQSVNLIGCTVRGKIVMSKDGGETPRLNLTNTPVGTIETLKPAIVEADGGSAISAISASANITVKGSETHIATIIIPSTVTVPIGVTVTAGNVAKVDAKGETDISGAGSVATVVAEKAVTVDSATVGKIEIPGTAAAGIAVTVTGNTEIEVVVNSANGAAITGSNVNVSTELDTPPTVTVGGEPVTHFHKWNEGVSTKEATCNNVGIKTYTCTATGCTDPAATKIEQIPALPHTIVIDKGIPATCTEAGKTEGNHCSVCNTVLKAQEIIPAGHTKVLDKAIPATCTEAGKTEGIHCSVCNTVLKAQEDIPALGHTKVLDKAISATCTEAGKTEGTHCSVCNTVLKAQEDIPVLGHDFTGTYQKDTEGHWHMCTRCNVTDTKATHAFTVTGCAQAATCTVCAYEKPAGQHLYGEWTYVSETKHKHTCTLCSTDETAAHTWGNGVVTTPPTETTEGVKTFTCPDCKGTKTEKIPVATASKITLIQTDNRIIEASWTGFDYPEYAVRLFDSSNIGGPVRRTDENTTGSLIFDLPQIDSGTEMYSLVLYSYAEGRIGDELARLDNAIEVTVAGEPVNYDIKFNDPVEDKHTLTWSDTMPTGILALISIDRPNGSSGSGPSIRPTGLTFYRPINYGDIFDCRILTTYTLDNQTLKATITPPSITTYTAPVKNSPISADDEQ